eukprot:COSAG02_NODE_55395_length_290_cov_7.596859_1_plen_56_part_10
MIRVTFSISVLVLLGSLSGVVVRKRLFCDGTGKVAKTEIKKSSVNVNVRLFVLPDR